MGNIKGHLIVLNIKHSTAIYEIKRTLNTYKLILFITRVFTVLSSTNLLDLLPSAENTIREKIDIL